MEETVLPVHVSCSNTEVSKITFDKLGTSADGIPVVEISVGMHLKIPVVDLLNSLLSFQEQSKGGLLGKAGLVPQAADKQVPTANADGRAEASAYRLQSESNPMDSSRRSWQAIQFDPAQWETLPLPALHQPILDYNSQNSWEQDDVSTSMVLANELALSSVKFMPLPLKSRTALTYDNRHLAVGRGKRSVPTTSVSKAATIPTSTNAGVAALGAPKHKAPPPMQAAPVKAPSPVAAAKTPAVKESPPGL
eukprot:TRINITY_DN77014_c0_g1_i1.p1 TRINITY_DN77014_c0_g1~~TRINITY_DN77014_c0_g1_i1.p1  ORF type:complete len:250 (-),score=41.02 TRINITY_DN77014_c0_g1_i1:222-971(-)